MTLKKREKILIYSINIIYQVIAVALGLRFILKLFGANSNNQFVSWLYVISEPLLAPFIKIFPAPVLEEGVIVDISILLAIVIYGLGAWLLAQLIEFIAYSVDKKRT